MMSTGESAFSSITSKTANNVLIPKPHVTRRKNQGLNGDEGYDKYQVNDKDTIIEEDETDK
jgi:hypothetical protein